MTSAEPAAAQAGRTYEQYRNDLIVRGVTVPAVVVFLVTALYATSEALYAPQRFWPGRWAYLAETLTPLVACWLCRGRLRQHAQLVLLGADLTYTVGVLVQALQPTTAIAGAALAIAIKVMATAVFFPWQPRLQYISASVTIMGYWTVLYLGGRIGGADSALFQTLGPCIAAVLSAAGAAGIDRNRRAMFEARAWLQLATESAKVVLWTCDLRTLTIRFSSGRKRVLGRDESEIPVAAQWDLVHPDDRTQAIATLQAHLQKRTSLYENERRMLHADGSYRWVLIRSTTAYDIEGQPCGQYGADIDITERKALEETLHEARAALEIAVTAARVGLWDWDLQTGETHYADSWRTLFGYSPAEIDGSMEAWSKIVHPDDLERLARTTSLATAIAGPTAHYEEEFRLRHRNGTYRWVLSRARVLRDAAGIPQRMLGAHVDISELKRAEDAARRSARQLQALTKDLDARVIERTGQLSEALDQRKQAEQALRQQSHRNKLLLQTASDGIHILDVQGRVVEVNAAFCAMLGYSTEELTHMWVGDWDAQWNEQELRARLSRLLEQPAVFESTHRRKDGTTIDVEISATAVDIDGETLLYASARDITARKRVEEALRESEERFHNAFRYAPTGMAILSFDGQFFRVNRVLCELLGFSEQELQSLSPGDLVHPEDLPAATADAIRVAAHETDGYRAQRRYHHKSGRIVHTDASLFLVRDHERNPLYYVAQLLDVTERKRAEEALRKVQEDLEARVEARTADVRESNRQLQEEILQRQQVQYKLQNVNSRITGLLNSMSAGFIAIDHEWRVTYMNRGAELITRLDVAAVIGKNVWDLFPGAVKTVFGERARKAMSEWVTDDTEFYNAQLNKWLQVHTYPIPDGICVLFEDITDRHTREGSIVSEIIQALNAYLDVANAFPSVTIGLRSLTDCNRAAFALFDDAHERLTLIALDTMGAYVGSKSPHIPISDSPGARSVLAGRPHFVPDLAAEMCSPTVRLVYEEGFRSSLSLPLRANERILGMLTMFWREVGGGNASQLPLLGQIADALGLAVEKTRLFQEVRVGHERLQALSGRLMEVQEEERRHIARELHDEIGQHLTGLKLVLDAARRLPVESERDRLGEAYELVEELIERTRALSLDLRPAMLDDLGLLPALLWLFDRFAMQTAVQVNFEHHDLHRRLPAEVETAAYRIVQEALTNVARYAGVKQVAVRAWIECAAVKLQVVDRGAGFDPDEAPSRHGSSGIVGMRERARLVGGRVTIESSPGSGTQVIAELPLPNATVAVR
ncbi:MAG: PAS domain S-box protein [Candidatus Binatia bacterium]